MTGIEIAAALATTAAAFGAGLIAGRRTAEPEAIPLTGDDMADIEITRGSTVAYTITIPEGQGVETLEGLTPRAELRGQTDTLDMTVFVVSSAKRRISITANAAQTLRMPLGVYRMVITLTAVGGLVRTTFAIPAEVTPGIFDA